MAENAHGLSILNPLAHTSLFFASIYHFSASFWKFANCKVHSFIPVGTIPLSTYLMYEGYFELLSSLVSVLPQLNSNCASSFLLFASHCINCPPL